MAKKRARGPAAEPSRAAIKAHERRAAQTVPGRASTAPAAERNVPVAADEPAAEAPPVRRGVLPPRVSRAAANVPTLTREQELRYITGDLRRMTVLALLMVAIIIALAFIVPLVVG
jgi:hypothetical protein